jgi:hypothetical protein
MSANRSEKEDRSETNSEDDRRCRDINSRISLFSEENLKGDQRWIMMGKSGLISLGIWDSDDISILKWHSIFFSLCLPVQLSVWSKSKQQPSTMKPLFRLKFSEDHHHPYPKKKTSWMIKDLPNWLQDRQVYDHATFINEEEVFLFYSFSMDLVSANVVQDTKVSSFYVPTKKIVLKDGPEPDVIVGGLEEEKSKNVKQSAVESFCQGLDEDSAADKLSHFSLKNLMYYLCIIIGVVFLLYIVYKNWLLFGVLTKNCDCLTADVQRLKGKNA